VLLGNSDGTFQPQQTSDIGSQPRSVAVADLNGDGNPDLVTVNYDNTASVLLGDGDGTFAPLQHFQASTVATIYAVAVADLNGDGKPDMVVANQGTFNPTTGTFDYAVDVLLGNGDGTFGPPQTFAVGSYHPTSVAVADVNGDGKPDLVVFGDSRRGWVFVRSIKDRPARSAAGMCVGAPTVPDELSAASRIGRQDPQPACASGRQPCRTSLTLGGPVLPSRQACLGRVLSPHPGPLRRRQSDRGYGAQTGGAHLSTAQVRRGVRASGGKGV
jgi:hypothetical protein